MTAPTFPQDRTGDWQWMLAACRGEFVGEGALRCTSTVRAALAWWATHDPEMVERHHELADAIDEGDCRHPGDPRRHLAVEIGPEPVDVDPETDALYDLRVAVGTPRVAEAIAAALAVGVPTHVVRSVIAEVHDG